MANTASSGERAARPGRPGSPASGRSDAPAERSRPTGRDEIYDAVLDAAERRFASDGPTGVSLREIAREAGVTYGLVHRHFGTKEQLIEQLLIRYAERWRTQLQSLGSYGEALELLLGPGPETGAYLRLLAWTLLAGDESASADAHRRHALLDLLPPMRSRDGADASGDGAHDDDADRAAARDATLKTAASLAFVFGWRFFNPFIRAALHLDADDPATIHAAMRAELRAMLGPAADAPPDRSIDDPAPAGEAPRLDGSRSRSRSSEVRDSA